MRYLLINARIFNGENLIDADSIAFDENGIFKIGDRKGINADHIIDCTGKTVIPGLIDCHVHLGVLEGNPSQSQSIAYALEKVKDLARFGITGLRCCGTANDEDITLRDMIENGLVSGPRIVASGMGITTTGGHGWNMCHQCDNADEIRKATRIQVRKGTNQIKIFASGGMATKATNPDNTQFSEEEMRIACQIAKAEGLISCAHATGLKAAKLAIKAGITSIEHTQLDQEACDLMIKNGTWYVSTIVTRYGIVNTEDPRYQWIKAKAKPGDIERMLKAISYCKEYGIPMAAGTDAGFNDELTPWGSSLVKELWLYTQAGLTNEEALRTATANAADLCRLSNTTGRLKEGFSSDIVIINGDPLADINALHNVFMTFIKGNLSFNSNI